MFPPKVKGEWLPKKKKNAHFTVQNPPNSISHTHNSVKTVALYSL